MRDELRRSCVATQFLPVLHTASSSERTVAADWIEADGQGVLKVDQSRVLALQEASQPFMLSKEQYHVEGAIGTGATLAARAANTLAQKRDQVIFGGDVNPGLVGTARDQHVITVPLRDAEVKGQYGEKIFKAVVEAYGYLQSRQQYGPYALVLGTQEFADAHAPLSNTLIMPADRIRPLMTAGFHATGMIPKRSGIVVSVGGNTVDVAIAVDGATAFTQVDDQENYRFRVYERSTVRIKDPRALVLLEFA